MLYGPSSAKPCRRGLRCPRPPLGCQVLSRNYRAGKGGRKAPNKRVVVGRVDRITPDQARRQAQEVLGRVAAGDDPAGERAEARGLPRLGEACEDYIKSGHGRAASTERGYRRYTALHLGDWLSRPLDSITRRDVEGRFRLLTERHGETPANQCLSFLRSVYRRPRVDYEGLRNPVEQWLAAGARYHRKRPKRISSPAEVLPCWHFGSFPSIWIEAITIQRNCMLYPLLVQSKAYKFHSSTPPLAATTGLM